MLSCMPTYNIPKKKARLKVEKLASGSREYRQFHRAFYDSIFSIRTISKYYFVNNVYEVHSPELESRYNRQRKIWREKGYTEELTSDTLCFLNIDDHSFQSVSDILRTGIEAGNLTESVLCDPSLGVQVSKHADVTSENVLRDAERTILVFKFMKGKVKTVDEQMEHLSDLKREPQVGFDTFTSQLTAKQSDSLFLSRMYYIFHFESEMDVVPAKIPPQICPVAVINFRHSLNAKNAVPIEPKFCMDTLLTYLETGKLPLLQEPGKSTAAEQTVTQSSSTAAERHQKSSRYMRRGSMSEPKPSEASVQEDSSALESLDDTEPELYQPTSDMRDRPSFLKLDRESAKWRELVDIFNTDVCRDADYITVTEMYYVMAQKLLDKYASLKDRWSTIGYTQYEMSDLHGYINVTDHTIKQLGEITSDGLAVGNCEYSVLADPSQGVQVSQCPDLLSTTREMAYEKLVLMFKYMPGRQLEVSDTFDVKELPAPSSGYDSIVSSHRHSAHASHYSKLTYLYTYKGSASPATPAHICPVAFLRIKYRKGLRHKIPAVKIPDIEVLKRCMTTITPRAPVRETVSRRTSAPIGKSASGEELSASSRVKAADHRQVRMYSPSSLKRTQSMPRSYSSPKSKKVQSQSESPLSSHEQSLVREAIEQSLNESAAEDSSESVFQQPKPWLSDSKVKNFKSLLKRAITSPAVGDEVTTPSSPGPPVSDASPLNVSQNSSSVSSVPLGNVAAVQGKSSMQMDLASDSSSDESLILRHVPKLSYGRGKRNRVLSSDSPTESESDSPMRMTPRRAARVIDSDDSEIEDSSKPKKRYLSKFRRTPAMTHSAVYTSDSNTTVISCANDDAIVVEPVQADISHLPSGANIHPLILDSVVQLERLSFPKHSQQDLSCSTKLNLKQVNFELELWGLKEEPNNAELQQDDVPSYGARGKLEANPLLGTNKPATISTSEESRLAPVILPKTGPSKDPSKESSKDLPIDPVSVWKCETASKQKAENASTPMVANETENKSKPTIVNENENKPKPTFVNEHENKPKPTFVNEHENKPKESKKVLTAPTTAPPTESKKSTTSTVYEEVDIFASVRNQAPEKTSKRKRRKSVSVPSSVAKEPVVAETPELEEVSKKNVQFNFELNTIHYYEADIDIKASEKKPAKQANVIKEALPMKKRPMFSQPDNVKPVSSPAPVASKIEGENLKPVVDTSKGYMRLPDLPMFHERPRKDSLPGSIPKDESGDTLAPKIPDALLHPPTNESVATGKTAVYTPFVQSDIGPFASTSFTLSAAHPPTPALTLPAVCRVGLPMVSGVAPPTISGVAPPAISGVAPPTGSGMTKPAISGVTPSILYGVAPPIVTGVAPPLKTGMVPLKPSGVMFPKTLDASPIAISGVSPPLTFSRDTASLLNSSSSLSANTSKAIDNVSAVTTAFSSSDATAVIPGVSTPYSPDEEKSDPDFTDIDEMLEASEANKKQQASEANKKQQTTLMKAALAVTNKLTKLMAQKIATENVSLAHSDMKYRTEKDSISAQKHTLDGNLALAKSIPVPVLTAKSTASKGAVSSDTRSLSTKSTVVSVSPVTSQPSSVAKHTQHQGKSMSSGDVSFGLAIPSNISSIDMAAIKGPAESKSHRMPSLDSTAAGSRRTNETANDLKMSSKMPSTITPHDTMPPSSAKFTSHHKTTTSLPISRDLLTDVTAENKIHSQSGLLKTASVSKESNEKKIKFALRSNDFQSNQKKQKLETDRANIESQSSLLTATDLKKLSNLATLPTCLVNVARRPSTSKPADFNARTALSTANSSTMSASAPGVVAREAVISSPLRAGKDVPELPELKVKQSPSATEHLQQNTDRIFDMAIGSAMASSSLGAIDPSQLKQSSSASEQLQQEHDKSTKEPRVPSRSLDDSLVSQVKQSSATAQIQKSPTRRTNVATESHLESASDTIKALNSIAVKSHLPSQLVIAKKPGRLNTGKSKSELLIEAPPSTETSKPTKHVGSKTIDGKDVKTPEATDTLSVSSVQDKSPAGLADVPTPVHDSSLVFKELFKGRRLPKSLLIDKPPKDRIDGSLSPVGNLRAVTKTEMVTKPGRIEAFSQADGGYLQAIKSSSSSMDLLRSEARLGMLSRESEVESVHSIAAKRPRFDDSNSWRIHLSTRTKRELKSIDKCTKFLLKAACTRDLEDVTGYIDPHLDLAHEKARVNSLRIPIFHKTRIDGCTAVSHLIMTCANDAADTTVKSDAIFWETCPDISSCTCISFTTAKELLAKDDDDDHMFNNQDEIDTVRLAIAYSESADKPTEHIVKLGSTPALYRHIDPNIVDLCDRELSELSLHQRLSIDDDFGRTTVKFIISCNSTDGCPSTGSTSSGQTFNLGAKLDGKSAPPIASVAEQDSSVMSQIYLLPQSTLDRNDGTSQRKKMSTSMNLLDECSTKRCKDSLEVVSSSNISKERLNLIEHGDNITSGLNSSPIWQSDDMAIEPVSDGADGRVHPDVVHYNQVIGESLTEQSMFVEINQVGQIAGPTLQYTAYVMELAAATDVTLYGLPPVPIVQLTSSIEDVQQTLPLSTQPVSISNVAFLSKQLNSALPFEEQSTCAASLLQSVHISDVKFAAMMMAFPCPLHIAAVQSAVHVTRAQQSCLSHVPTVSIAEHPVKIDRQPDLPASDEKPDTVSNKQAEVPVASPQPTVCIPNGQILSSVAAEPNVFSSVEVHSTATVTISPVSHVKERQYTHVIEKTTIRQRIPSILPVRELLIEEMCSMNFSNSVATILPSIHAADVKSVVTLMGIQHVESVTNSLPVYVRKFDGTSATSTTDTQYISPCSRLANAQNVQPTVIDSSLDVQFISPLLPTPCNDLQLTPPLLPTPAKDALYTATLLPTPSNEMQSTPPLLRTPTIDVPYSPPLLPTPSNEVQSTPILLRTPTIDVPYSSPLLPTPSNEVQSTPPLLRTPTIDVQSIIKKINSVKKVNKQNEVYTTEVPTITEGKITTPKRPNDNTRKILSYAHSFDSDADDEECDVQMRSTGRPDNGPRTKRRKRNAYPVSETIGGLAVESAVPKNPKGKLKGILKNPSQTEDASVPHFANPGVVPPINRTIVNDVAMPGKGVTSQFDAIHPYSNGDACPNGFRNIDSQKNMVISEFEPHETAVHGEHNRYRDHYYNTTDGVLNQELQADTIHSEQQFPPSYDTFFGNNPESSLKESYQMHSNASIAPNPDSFELQQQAGQLIELAKKIQSNDMSFGDAVKVMMCSQNDGRPATAKLNISDRLGRKVSKPEETKLGLFDIPAALQNLDTPSYTRDEYEDRNDYRYLRGREQARDGQRVAMYRRRPPDGMDIDRHHPYGSSEQPAANHSRYFPGRDTHQQHNTTDRLLPPPSSSRATPRNETFRTRAWDQAQL